MKRALAVGFGLLYVLVPDKIVNATEQAAFENPDDGQLRSITIPIARLEGLAFCTFALRGQFPKPLRAPLTLLGFMLAAIPQQMLAYGLAIAYENPTDLEVKPWVVPVARVIGVLYVILGLFVGRVDAPTDDGGETEPLEG
ncbi:hypothetical protein [Natronolimnobius baerhuensis]|uniref:Uncharacterized protein n=1 Tax=Natronolimnobius baerhuensis TaxID=253108 RepID=A0A202E6E8_9EURY|nr:hypothetical protein [Natronolimnobius baerhuensis]OVE83490.1 hypothetical protein B2G88_13680 [Natronolimnobius baerhuensis]